MSLRDLARYSGMPMKIYLDYGDGVIRTLDGYQTEVEMMQDSYGGMEYGIRIRAYQSERQMIEEEFLAPTPHVSVPKVELLEPKKPSGKWFCPWCGSRNDEDRNHCEMCGGPYLDKGGR